MHLIAHKPPQRGLEAVLTSDDGRQITWSISQMSRNIKAHDLVFKEVNEYWETVSARRRKQIFNLYADIQDHIDEVFDVKMLQKVLVDKVRELLELHPVNELSSFIGRSKITYPSSVKNTGTVQFQPDKTYDMEKYHRLLVLVLAIRVLTPIWGVYVAIMDKYAGKNHKELMALRLISRSWIKDYSGFAELQAYVNANIKEDESSLSSVMGDVGSVMIPEWLLALICVRKLATKQISGDGENNNIVSNIHSIVTQNIKGKDKTFAGYFRNKEVRKEADENLSLLEEYKIKQVVTEGDKEIFILEAGNLVKAAKNIDDTIDPETVKLAWEYNRSALDCSVTMAHRNFMMWICGPYLPPSSINILNKINKLQLMSVTQTVLWHWGYPQLAAFMVARRVTDGMANFQVPENRSRFPKELTNQITHLYPHIPQNIKLDKRHPIVDLITRTVEDLSASDWQIEGPPELLKEVNEYMVDGQYVTPGDVQRQIAELVVYIAERNQ